jgi:hypothetical protein
MGAVSRTSSAWLKASGRECYRWGRDNGVAMHPGEVLGLQGGSEGRRVGCPQVLHWSDR